MTILAPRNDVTLSDIHSISGPSTYLGSYQILKFRHSSKTLPSFNIPSSDGAVHAPPAYGHRAAIDKGALLRAIGRQMEARPTVECFPHQTSIF